MKKILMAVAILALAVSMAYAAENDQPKATEPIGAVLETGGVLIGKFTSVIEKSLGGGKKENALVMAEDNGKTKIVPLDSAVKCLDNTFHAVTLNQLTGRKVKVDVSSESGKATAITEVK
jgi:hypothetical protein